MEDILCARLCVSAPRGEGYPIQGAATGGAEGQETSLSLKGLV